MTNDGWAESPSTAFPDDMMSGKRALAYYTAEDLPFYYWLASEFAIADHYHCSIPGPTWPNRMYLYAATSFGAVHNDFVTPGDTIFDNLEKREVDWKVYVSTTPGFAIFVDKYFELSKDEHGHFVPIAQYFTDAAAGKLPAVAFVDPGIAHEAYDQNDEHPPAIAMVGENVLGHRDRRAHEEPAMGALGALFHVRRARRPLRPRRAPAGVPARRHRAEARAGRHGREVRPAMASACRSSSSRPAPRSISSAHRTYDHTSIVRFVEARFQMPALTNRDANAEAPWEMFDFDSPPHETAPTVTIPTVDQAKLDACKAIFNP